MENSVWKTPSIDGRWQFCSVRTNNGLYCNKWINIPGWIIYKIRHGQVIWCEGRIYVSLVKTNITTFSSMSISSSCMFFCFQLPLLYCWYIPIFTGTRIAESSGNCLPALSFHLPGAECFQIFRNLPNVLWEPSL